MLKLIETMLYFWALRQIREDAHFIPVLASHSQFQVPLGI